ncbi:MAG: glycoside hydrolase family 3 C-terminal domain-containing protein [Caulobacteraceae bacterium]
MAIRVVTAVVEAGLLGRPAAGAPDRDVRSAAHTDLARRIELEGAVLLKNDGVLPLAATAKTIAVIGEDAAGHVQTTEAYGGFVTREGIPVSTPLDALKARLTGASILYAPTPTGVDPLPAFEPPGGFRVDYFADADLAGTPAQTAQAATVDLAAPPPGLAGQPWSARWTARFTPPASGRHTFSLSGGGWAQLYVDRRLTAEVFKEQFRLVSQGVVELEAGRPVELRIDYRPASTIIGPKLQLGWSGPAEAEATTAAAAAAAKSADVALVFAGDAVSEGGDRTSLALPGDQDRLIAAVAAANPRTVVVLNTVGPVLMPWLGQVAGVVEAWYGGEQDGAAMAALLTGDEDFSGRLTATFPADESQGPGVTAAAFPGRDLAVTYDEGIDVGYRFYDSHGQAPLFPFGYGLSYTTFQLRRPSLRREAGGVIVGAEVANIGRRAGAEVAQLYLGFPPAAGEPPWQLKGFQRVKVAPGQAQAASFRLGPEAFQVYDPRLKAWCTPAGAFEIRIARDSRDPGAATPACG